MHRNIAQSKLLSEKDEFRDYEGLVAIGCGAVAFGGDKKVAAAYILIIGMR